MATAHEAISLDWSGYKSQHETVNPFMVAAERHGQVNREQSRPGHAMMSLQRQCIQYGLRLALLSECY